MNNVKKGLHCLLAKSNNSPIQKTMCQEKKWRFIPPLLKKSRELYGLSPWKKKMIPKIVITVGCNGPTKINVTLEGMVKDITQGL